ncbi:hypothetical protein CUBB_gp226c [Staphylococcus phage CUB-B]|nr:hypothetical protein CUBB_gp226c [Staphylococcus phage CUB-B]
MFVIIIKSYSIIFLFNFVICYVACLNFYTNNNMYLVRCQHFSLTFLKSFLRCVAIPYIYYITTS